MVQLRLPVVAVVELLVARRVLRVRCGRRGHGLLEGGAADDGVDMGRHGALADDGIAALDGQRLAVDREDLAMGEVDQGQAQSREKGRVKGRHGDAGNWPALINEIWRWDEDIIYICPCAPPSKKI